MIANDKVLFQIQSVERRVTQHREGHIHYLKSGHYFIIGYDDMMPSIITHIFEKNEERFVHHDIRPFGYLGAIYELDFEFSRYIPWIIKMTEGDECV